MPSGAEWPITDWKSWEKLKEERLSLKDVRSRLPANWEDLVQGVPSSVTTRWPWAATRTASSAPPRTSWATRTSSSAISRSRNSCTTSSIRSRTSGSRCTPRSLAEVEIDHVQIWEDISYGSGSMVAPAMIREFVLPYIRRLTDFCRARGITHHLPGHRRGLLRPHPPVRRGRRNGHVSLRGELRNGHREGEKGLPLSADDGRHPQVGHLSGKGTSRRDSARPCGRC